MTTWAPGARAGLVDLATVAPHVAALVAAWQRIALAEVIDGEEPDPRCALPIRARELTLASGLSDRARRRALVDAEDAGLVVITGTTGHGAHYAQTGYLDTRRETVVRAYGWLRSAVRCVGCRRLRQREGRRCRRCRVQQRHDMRALVAAEREARALAAAGRRVSPTALAARHGAPLWTRELDEPGHWQQGLVRRLLEAEIIVGEAAAYWRERERAATGGGHMGEGGVYD